MQVRSPAVDDALHIIGLHHLGVVRQRLAGAFAHDLGDYFAAIAIEELASVPRVVSWSRIPVPVLTAAAINATGMYSYGLRLSVLLLPINCVDCYSLRAMDSVLLIP